MRRKNWILVLFFCILIVFRLWLALTPALNDYPRVTGDEGWILSVSEHFARTGVLGSPLYRGFYDTDRGYFFPLPVINFLQALSFLAIGFSIESARLVSVISLLIVFVCSILFAYREFGLLSAVLAGFFLLYWQPIVGTTPSGLLLIEAGRSARYDMAALALVCVTVLATAEYQRRQSWWLALIVGLSAGAATLTQFFGAFVVPVVIVAMLPRTTPTHEWLRSVILALGGFLAIILPYTLFALLHWDVYYGRVILMNAARSTFHPEKEPARYALTLPDSLLIIAALLNLVRRLYKSTLNNSGQPVNRSTLLATWLVFTFLGLTPGDYP